MVDDRFIKQFVQIYKSRDNGTFSTFYIKLYLVVSIRYVVWWLQKSHNPKYIPTYYLTYLIDGFHINHFHHNFWTHSFIISVSPIRFVSTTHFYDFLLLDFTVRIAKINLNQRKTIKANFCIWIFIRFLRI